MDGWDDEMDVTCVLFLFKCSLSLFFLKKVTAAYQNALACTLFCLIFLARVHSGHPAIQRISLHFLLKPAKPSWKQFSEVCHHWMYAATRHIAKLYQPPSSSAAATFKVVQKNIKKQGEFIRPKMMSTLSFHGLLSLLLTMTPPKSMEFPGSSGI